MRALFSPLYGLLADLASMATLTFDDRSRACRKAVGMRTGS